MTITDLLSLSLTDILLLTDDEVLRANMNLEKVQQILTTQTEKHGAIQNEVQSC